MSYLLFYHNISVFAILHLAVLFYLNISWKSFHISKLACFLYELGQCCQGYMSVTSNFFKQRKTMVLNFFSSCFPVLLLIPKRIRDKEIVPTAVLENMKVGKNRTVHSVLSVLFLA